MLSFSTFYMFDSPSEVCQYWKYTGLQIALTQTRDEWQREMSRQKQHWMADGKREGTARISGKHLLIVPRYRDEINPASESVVPNTGIPIVICLIKVFKQKVNSAEYRERNKLSQRQLVQSQQILIISFYFIKPKSSYIFEWQKDRLGSTIQDSFMIQNDWIKKPKGNLKDVYFRPIFAALELVILSYVFRKEKKKKESICCWSGTFSRRSFKNKFGRTLSSQNLLYLSENWGFLLK